MSGKVHDLGDLPSRGIPVGPEGVISIAVEDTIGVCCLDVAVERVARRYVCEAWRGNCVAQVFHPGALNGYLSYLPSRHVGVWSERSIIVPCDDVVPPCRHDVRVEWVVRWHITEWLLVPRVQRYPECQHHYLH